MVDFLKLVVVIPAFNEQDCIQSVLKGWYQEIQALSDITEFRILVINDGSTDLTEKKIQEILPQYPKVELINRANGGHGEALYQGYQLALDKSPDYIFQVDSDDQFNPEDFHKIWKLRGPVSSVQGMRVKRHDPLSRIVINFIMKFLILLRFRCWIQDPNIPFRLYPKGIFIELWTKLPKSLFAPNLFLNILAYQIGHPIHFIPITHKARQTGQVSIIRWGLVKACLRSARELLFFKPSPGGGKFE